MLDWKVIDENYLNYLRKYEARIPFTNYGNNRLKPFFGCLFMVDDLMYVTQVSSPKDRHKHIKQSLDFIKLFDGTNLLAVVNLNYMFPVPISLVTDLKYADIDKYVTFSNISEKNKYISLLKKEMNIIQNRSIVENAKDIYSLKVNNPKHTISQRSFDFKQLEQLANNYISNNNFIGV